MPVWQAGTLVRMLASAASSLDLARPRAHPGAGTRIIAG